MRKYLYKLQFGVALLLALNLYMPAQTARAAILEGPAWSDVGIVYIAPTGGAYYPSVLFDVEGFGIDTPLYKMWYSNGGGQVFLTTSANGMEWGSPAQVSGLGDDAHHVQVLYDENCFGVDPCEATTPKYKIWYWDINADLYSIEAIASAQSVDGLAWTDDTSLSQSATEQLITGAGTGWNRGSYGPVSLVYQDGADNTGSDPWDYSYAMYYDGTDGSSEVTGLAYSTDGLYWSAYSASPVLDKGSGNTWDCDDAAYGSVYYDGMKYHYWYSGGGGDNGSGGCVTGAPVQQGIGYAASDNGVDWIKTAQPVFHITDGVTYRDQRTYTPSVVDDGSGMLKMYYTAAGSAFGNTKMIALAVTSAQNVFVDDDWVGQPNGTEVAFPGSSTAHFIGLDAFDTIQKGVDAVAEDGTVNVAAGTYTEQISITKSLHLVGASAASTSIVAPPTLPAASNPTSVIVMISGAGVNVELTGFTVKGPGPSACGSILAGIFVRDNAVANIHHNTIQDIRDNVVGGVSGCQNGVGIFVGRQFLEHRRNCHDR